MQEVRQNCGSGDCSARISISAGETTAKAAQTTNQQGSDTVEDDEGEVAGSTKVSNDVAQKAQQPESAGGKQAERDHAHGDKVHMGDHEHNNVVASAARAAEEYSQVAGAEQQGIQQADCRLQVDVHKADPGCKQLEQCISQPPSVKFSAYTVQEHEQNSGNGGVAAAAAPSEVQAAPQRNGQLAEQDAGRDVEMAEAAAYHEQEEGVSGEGEGKDNAVDEGQDRQWDPSQQGDRGEEEAVSEGQQQQPGQLPYYDEGDDLDFDVDQDQEEEYWEEEEGDGGYGSGGWGGEGGDVEDDEECTQDVAGEDVSYGDEEGVQGAAGAILAAQKDDEAEGPVAAAGEEGTEGDDGESAQQDAAAAEEASREGGSAGAGQQGEESRLRPKAGGGKAGGGKAGGGQQKVTQKEASAGAGAESAEGMSDTGRREAAGRGQRGGGRGGARGTDPRGGRAGAGMEDGGGGRGRGRERPPMGRAAMWELDRRGGRGSLPPPRDGGYGRGGRGEFAGPRRLPPPPLRRLGPPEHLPPLERRPPPHLADPGRGRGRGRSLPPSLRIHTGDEGRQVMAVSPRNRPSPRHASHAREHLPPELRPRRGPPLDGGPPHLHSEDVGRPPRRRDWEGAREPPPGRFDPGPPPPLPARYPPMERPPRGPSLAGRGRGPGPAPPPRFRPSHEEPPRGGWEGPPSRAVPRASPPAPAPAGRGHGAAAPRSRLPSVVVAEGGGRGRGGGGGTSKRRELSYSPEPRSAKRAAYPPRHPSQGYEPPPRARGREYTPDPWGEEGYAAPPQQRAAPRRAPRPEAAYTDAGGSRGGAYPRRGPPGGGYPGEGPYPPHLEPEYYPPYDDPYGPPDMDPGFEPERPPRPPRRALGGPHADGRGRGRGGRYSVGGPRREAPPPRVREGFAGGRRPPHMDDYAGGAAYPADVDDARGDPYMREGVPGRGYGRGPQEGGSGHPRARREDPYHGVGGHGRGGDRSLFDHGRGAFYEVVTGEAPPRRQAPPPLVGGEGYEERGGGRPLPRSTRGEYMDHHQQYDEPPPQEYRGRQGPAPQPARLERRERRTTPHSPAGGPVYSQQHAQGSRSGQASGGPSSLDAQPLSPEQLVALAAAPALLAQRAQHGSMVAFGAAAGAGGGGGAVQEKQQQGKGYRQGQQGIGGGGRGSGGALSPLPSNRGRAGRVEVEEEAIWFYTDPQGVQRGPHSISQFRRWLDGLSQRPDLRAEYATFRGITVFRRDRAQGVPLMMLLE